MLLTIGLVLSVGALEDALAPQLSNHFQARFTIDSTFNTDVRGMRCRPQRTLGPMAEPICRMSLRISRNWAIGACLRVLSEHKKQSITPHRNCNASTLRMATDSSYTPWMQPVIANSSTRSARLIS